MTDGTITTPDAPPAELAHRKPDAAPVGLFGTSDPAETIERATVMAKALTDVIIDRQLFVDMGKERRHVIVEGWQLLGAMIGVTTKTEWTRHATDANGEWAPPETRDVTVTLHSDYCNARECSGTRNDPGPQCKTYTRTRPEIVEPGRGGWEARVIAVRSSDDAVMGTAEAECRWSESKWRDRDSYAVRSMAQTRATSKAYSQALRFIVTLAGFSGTPAEEMDGIHTGGDGAGNDPVLDAQGVDVSTFKCPACGSDVFDNRPTNTQRRAEGKNNMPSFKCRNRDCDGTNTNGESVTEGSVGEPWITWHDSFFYRRHPAVVDAFKRVYAAATDIGDFARQAWEEAAASFGFGMYDVPIDELDDVTSLAVTMASTYAGVDVDDPTGDPPPAPDTFDIDDTCPECGGRGGFMSAADNADIEMCDRCNGSGRIDDDDEPVDAEIVDDDTRPFA